MAGRFVYLEDAEVVRLTDKAVLVYYDDEQHWLPRSQIEDEGEHLKIGAGWTIGITKWIADQKGIETDERTNPTRRGAVPLVQSGTRRRYRHRAEVSSSGNGGRRGNGSTGGRRPAGRIRRQIGEGAQADEGAKGSGRKRQPSGRRLGAASWQAVARVCGTYSDWRTIARRAGTRGARAGAGGWARVAAGGNLYPVSAGKAVPAGPGQYREPVRRVCAEKQSRRAGFSGAVGF